MKLSLLLVAVFASDVAHAIPLRNNNPSIWAQETISTMNHQIQELYKLNLGLYDARHIFDPGSHDCISPPPESKYLTGNSCPNGNKIAAKAILGVDTAWKALASAMFPVYYGLVDTASKPRATFSGFSHFYNHLLLEIQSLQNTTAYYICRGNIYPLSALWNATLVADGVNYLTVEAGPPDESMSPPFAKNGTDGDGIQGHNVTFFSSIQKNREALRLGWENQYLGMQFPGRPGPQSVCKEFSKNGLQHPRDPLSYQ